MTGISLERIDRSIYNHLRVGLVIGGFLPRLEDFIANDDNLGYQLARKTIKDSEKTTNIPLVDIYGVGTGETREDEAENCKIIISRVGMSVGSVGSAYTSHYQKNGGGFDRIKNPDNTFDLSFEVRLLVRKTAHERDLSSLILSILGTTRYLPIYKDYDQMTEDCFLLNFEGVVDVSSEIDTMEKLFRYSVKDVSLQPSEVLQRTGTIGDTYEETEIVPLTSVHYKTNLYDGSADFSIQ